MISDSATGTVLLTSTPLSKCSSVSILFQVCAEFHGVILWRRGNPHIRSGCTSSRSHQRCHSETQQTRCYEVGASKWMTSRVSCIESSRNHHFFLLQQDEQDCWLCVKFCCKLQVSVLLLLKTQKLSISLSVNKIGSCLGVVGSPCRCRPLAPCTAAAD